MKKRDNEKTISTDTIERLNQITTTMLTLPPDDQEKLLYIAKGIEIANSNIAT